MKRSALLREIQRAARRSDVPWRLVEQGGDHEAWACGDVRVYLPRHREINDRTAERIRQHLQAVLGKRWWA